MQNNANYFSSKTRKLFISLKLAYFYSFISLGPILKSTFMIVIYESRVVLTTKLPTLQL